MKDPIKRDIFENFRVYGLERPELIRMDNHVFDRHVTLVAPSSSSSSSAAAAASSAASSSSSQSAEKSNNTTNSSGSGSDSGSGSGSSDLGDMYEGMFDAIVTDPPYGIRAGAKKSGKRKQVNTLVSCLISVILLSALLYDP